MKPLSFIIITYNRPGDTLELLENIKQLNNAADLLQDVIVLNNASTENYSLVRSFIQQNISLPFQFIEAPENLGVTKGRNYALQFAKENILIFLDDDAILQNKNTLNNVLKAFESNGFDDREVAIVSFKVLYYDTLEMQVNALPHKDFKNYKDKSEFYTYYFAGGAHAIKKIVLEQAGNLPEEFFYGMEEYDLSYRILDKGYCIKYDSSIVMLHKESSSGRKRKSDKLRMMWVNKSKVAWRYLPKIYFYSTAFLWSAEYLHKTGFQFKGFLKGWKEVIQISSVEKRTPLKNSTLKYLKEIKARLWY